MKTAFIILTICMMANINTFGQTALKNGVYEFSTTTDAVGKIASGKSKGETTIHRTLIVKNDTVLYRIENIEKPENLPAYSFGIKDNYYLPLEKKSGNSCKAKNADIELNITTGTSETITVEVVKGAITGFASGGAYITHTEVLPPEKQTLTFVRELTAEDEKKLSQEKEKIINIPENTLTVIKHSVLKFERLHREEIYLTEIHRVPVETKSYPKDSWYGKAQEQEAGDFLYFSYIRGDYPGYYTQQTGFLHVIPNGEETFRLWLWLNPYLVFWNKELHEESKHDPQWHKIQGVDGDMWWKIANYYMENKDNPNE